MSDPENHIGISRLDQTAVGTHGWQVRLQRKGVRYGRFFSDSAWGGSEGALREAVAFRGAVIREVEETHARLKSSIRSHRAPAARNKSGVVGVTRIVQRSASGVEYHFWQASWTRGDGVRRTVRYSVLKYGDHDAYQLACEARKRAIG